MRRGHQGIGGGWRNESQRQFRPRTGGNPHFRPPRNFNLPNNNRFLPPGLHRHQYAPQLSNINPMDQDYHERNRHSQDRFSYSKSNEKNYYQKEKKMLPFIRHMKHGGKKFGNCGTQNSEPYSVNSMGDVDQRHPINPWAADDQFHDVDDRLYNQTYTENMNEINRPHFDYTGHRPPASDHYGCSSGSVIENSNTFSRSVDDTVNIVRKRLLSRGEEHQITQDDNLRENLHESRNVSTLPSRSQYEQSSKKKVPRPNKVNCEKIKSKIVHQLFKMDKEKMHKLLDNPNSSTKFEYAINSLLTESQNSFNQHLRSVAEKSLCSSSKEFMQDDNNTIYEDTFMKQMQCILDPQDTILLEDIKPVVMAELSNILRFDEVDDRYGHDNMMTDYQNVSFQQYSQDYKGTNSSYEAYNAENSNNYFEKLSPDHVNFDDYQSHTNNIQQENIEDCKPLFERRSRRKSFAYTNEEHQNEDHNEHSIVSRSPKPYEVPFDTPNQNRAVFDANAEFNDEEDTFAELDRQYHVAVDHDLIDNDDISNPVQNFDNTKNEESIHIKKSTTHTQQIIIPKTPNKIEQIAITDIDCQLQDMTSLELNSLIEDKTENLQKENENCQNKPIVNPPNTTHNDDVKAAEVSNTQKLTELSNSRKQIIEQRPSHRKEKRKKHDEHKIDKHDIKHSNSGSIDQSAKKLDNKKMGDSTLNLDMKKNSSINSSSEKHDKKKELPKKIKSNEERRRQSSTSSNYSISPKNQNTLGGQSLPKSDTKSCLKSIDMFTEVPKKINLHQAFRNTALNTIPKKVAEIKPKQVSSLSQKSERKRDVASQANKRYVTKETQTIYSKSSTSRFCQTERVKHVNKAIQINIPTPEKSKGSKSTDAFERMKEIDLEIQTLLQEKFKLYSSLESKEGTIPMQNLGMTVLNVNSLEENIEENDANSLLEDTIVENFTSIPEEELEQIAFETVEVEEIKPSPKNRRTKKRNNSNSSINSGTATKRVRKTKTPNFSLIEQIITDDRPLEDIISLDDLEMTPVKSNKKPKSKPKPKKKSVSKKNKKNLCNPENVNLRNCYVVLQRHDLKKLWEAHRTQYIDETSTSNTLQTSTFEATDMNTCTKLEDGTSQLHEDSQCQEIIEETVVSDIQFDMLDVSEDIVIGENYEEKCVEVKEVDENLAVPISEEIILGNSQCSLEGVSDVAEAQGGECKLYDYLSDESLQRDSLVVSGNADAILAVECVGSNFLAAGLDGNVYYFGADGQLITTLRGSNLAVTCLCIVKEKYGTTVYTGSLDSRIRNYDLDTGLEKGPECNVLSPIQTMDRAWDTVFVGTRTGFVLQFECRNNMLIPVSTVKFSDQSILSLRAMKEGPRKVLLVAARSENVTIKDAQTGLLLRTLEGPKMTVYTLLYEDGKVYCGTSSHQIQVFDYTSGSHVGTHEGGKGAVCLRAAGGLLFAGCYDGCVYVYREGEPRPMAQLRGPNLMLLCLAVVGTKIIAGFKDRSLYIWKIPLCILKEMIL